MEHSVKVTIELKDDKVIVHNNFGAKWELSRKDKRNSDHFLNGTIADIAGAMLTGQIVSHLANLSATKLTYTLSIDK